MMQCLKHKVQHIMNSLLCHAAELMTRPAEEVTSFGITMMVHMYSIRDAVRRGRLCICCKHVTDQVLAKQTDVYLPVHPEL